MLSTGKVPWRRGAIAWAPVFISWIDRMNRNRAARNERILTDARVPRGASTRISAALTSGAVSTSGAPFGASPFPPRAGARVWLGLSGSFPIRSRGRGAGDSPYFNPSPPPHPGPLVPFGDGEAVRTIRDRAEVGGDLGGRGPVRGRRPRRCP